MSLSDMYSRKDPTEVPSYFIGELVSGVGNALASGAGAVADVVSNVPVVGNVVGDVVSGVGSTIGNIANGNIVDGLGNLYTAADTAVGGILPGGQAFSQGYLGNLYGAADKALGGYLPNIGGGAAQGGVGYTPQYMSAQRAFNALPGPGGAAQTLTQPRSGGLSGIFDGSGMSWDKAQKIADIASKGYGIYQMTQKSPEQTNRQAYNRTVEPGQPSTGTMTTTQPVASPVSKDPAMGSAPVGGGNVPKTIEATGAGGVGDPSSLKDLGNDVKEIQETLEKISDTEKSPTQKAAEAGGITAPSNPQIKQPDQVLQEQAIMNSMRPESRADAIYATPNRMVQTTMAPTIDPNAVVVDAPIAPTAPPPISPEVRMALDIEAKLNDALSKTDPTSPAFQTLLQQRDFYRQQAAAAGSMKP